MELLKRISLYMVGIVVFVAFVNGFIDESKELYQLIQQQSDEQLEETVQGKAVHNGLFGKLTYYAVLTDGAEENVIYNSEARDYAEIPKSEFDALEIGDTLKGTLTGAAFSKEDIRSQIYEHFLLMAIALIYPTFFIIYQLIHIPSVNRWTNSHDKWLSRLFSGIFIAGLCIGLLFSYVSMTKDIVSTVQAHHGNQQETTALITDRYEDHSYSYKGYWRSYYYLALAFEDQEGSMINLTKAVPPSIFNNNDFSDKINYPEENPYRVYMDGIKVSDSFFYINALILYILTIVLTLLLIYAAFLMRRKKKTGSYWPVRKKSPPLDSFPP